MVTINRYIKALLQPSGGHQGSHKAHQAGNQFDMIQYMIWSNIWALEHMYMNVYKICMNHWDWILWNIIILQITHTKRKLKMVSTWKMYMYKTKEC